MIYSKLKEEVDEAKAELAKKQNILDTYIKKLSFSADEIMKEMNRMVKCSNFSEYPSEKLGEILINNMIGSREYEAVNNRDDATHRDY